MDAIHRKYSQESLKPASGVAVPNQQAEQKAEQKAEEGTLSRGELSGDG